MDVSELDFANLFAVPVKPGSIVLGRFGDQTGELVCGCTVFVPEGGDSRIIRSRWCGTCRSRPAQEKRT